ncbi:MAG TPA: hypothetical protein DGF10_02990 [Acidimicrobiaceae bacterium]|nr:hypothetical protein [Acidimicrobiaceae bacterium]
MLVLGINDSHDASACLVQDGRLLVAISEERLQRIKSVGGFPAHAIRACFEVAGVTARDVDHVAIATEKLVPNNIHNVATTFSVSDYLKWQEDYYYPILFENKQVRLADVFPSYEPKGDLAYPISTIPFATTNEVGADVLDDIKHMRRQFVADHVGIDDARISFHRHHRCHAWYAYYTNPNRHQRMAIVTADAGGDGAYDSVHLVENGLFREVTETRSNLIGKIYSSVTLLLGMRPNEHEYKVMGLAPYASEYHKQGPRNVFLDSLAVDGLKFKTNSEVRDHFFYFKDKLRIYRFDGIAGGLQDFVETRLCEWFENIGSELKTNHFAFNGGVANNVKANKRLIESARVDSFFVPPGPGDENLSIGAAYLAIYDQLGPEKAHEVIRSNETAYWGPDVDQANKRTFSEHPFIKQYYRQINNVDLREVAKVLAAGEIVGLCNGRMEFGSRALGHRSLIADPSSQDSVRKINDLIKKRDFWMPFTPSVLDSSYDDYIVNPKSISSAFMTGCFDTTELGRKHLKGATHPYDYTARPQRVTEDTCPRYHALITAFKEESGIGAVLNTSLNIHGKPIVMNPTDLIDEILVGGDIPLKYILIEDTFYARDFLI